MTKAGILKLLKHTYCRLRGSRIAGVGVFAIRDIPKGINPFMGMRQEYWKKFDKKELSGLDPAVWEMVEDFFVEEKNNTIYIPPYGLNGMDISFFVNSSKKPNLKTSNGFDFITMRQIKAGEELTVDYDTYDTVNKNKK